MSKFCYRLQSVLNLKEQLEDYSKNKLSKDLRILDKEKKKILYIDQEKEVYCEKIKQESVDGIYISKLRQYHQHLSLINDKRNQQLQNINTAKEHVNKSREELIEASKGKKTLEALREKHLQEFLYQEMKKEEKQVDEIVSYEYTIR